MKTTIYKYRDGGGRRVGGEGKRRERGGRVGSVGERQLAGQKAWEMVDLAGEEK